MDVDELIKRIEEITGITYTGGGEALSEQFITMLLKLIDMVVDGEEEE